MGDDAPGRVAYEARFSDCRPREVVPFDELPDDARAVWARVEEACRRDLEAQLAAALETVELMSLTLGGQDGA